MDTETANAVADEVRQREIRRKAAVVDTQGMRRAGWIILIIAWCLPIIPVIGLFFLGIGALVAFFLGILVGHKGNMQGGVILIFTAFIGSIVVAVIWLGIYAAFASL